MRSFLTRQSSPGTAISLVALFVALSGTAVALPGKNGVDRNDYKRGSIGTRAIANNSIRSSDIRTGNVRSSDVLDNAVTGADVNEGTLGKVPSAGSADSATTATTAGSAATAASAGTAGNAGNLDGIDSTGFLRPDANRTRAVFSDPTDDYGNDVVLAQLTNLSEGTYLVTAKVTIDNDGAADEPVNCDLVKNGAQVLDTSSQRLGADAAGAEQLGYHLIADAVAGASGTDSVSVRCSQPAGNDNDESELKIVVHREN